MTKKIFRSILLVAGAVLLAAMVGITGCVYGDLGRTRREELWQELDLAAAGVRAQGADYFSGLSGSGSRLTWVAADGTVLWDTQADAASMENHAGREEIRQAMETGYGESTRDSATLLQTTMYAARRLEDGTVLRISASRDTVWALTLRCLRPAAVILLGTLALSALLAGRLARHIVEPLNALDLEHPVENNTYEELSPLLLRLEQQRRRIRAQRDELTRRTGEFEQITGQLDEALALLDGKGNVLSINPAARRLFSVQTPCVGADFLTVDRSVELSRCIRTAMDQGSCAIQSRRDGLIYRFDVRRIGSREEPQGTVILGQDITRREQAEQARREFTANVSHELRTPPGDLGLGGPAGKGHGPVGGHPPLRPPNRGRSPEDGDPGGGAPPSGPAGRGGRSPPGAGGSHGSVPSGRPGAPAPGGGKGRRRHRHRRGSGGGGCSRASVPGHLAAV